MMALTTTNIFTSTIF